MTRWRFVVLTTAGATKGWTIDSVRRLRAAHIWAQTAYRHHQIDDWQWWPLPPLSTDQACPCGYQYAPGRTRTDTCRCGSWHAHYECIHCEPRDDPPHEAGCGPIPIDPERALRSRPLRHRPR